MAKRQAVARVEVEQGPVVCPGLFRPPQAHEAIGSPCAGPHVRPRLVHHPELAGVLFEERRAQRPLPRFHTLLVVAQRLGAVRHHLGQQDVGLGAIRIGGEGAPGKLAFPPADAVIGLKAKLPRFPLRGVLDGKLVERPPADLLADQLLQLLHGLEFSPFAQSTKDVEGLLTRPPVGHETPVEDLPARGRIQDERQRHRDLHAAAVCHGRCGEAPGIELLLGQRGQSPQAGFHVEEVRSAGACDVVGGHEADRHGVSFLARHGKVFIFPQISIWQHEVIHGPIQHRPVMGTTRVQVRDVPIQGIGPLFEHLDRFVERQTKTLILGSHHSDHTEGL